MLHLFTPRPRSVAHWLPLSFRRRSFTAVGHDDCNSIEVLSMQDDGKISILLFVRNTGSRVEQCGPEADSMQIQTNCIRPSRRLLPLIPPHPLCRSKALLDAFHRREIEEYFLRQLYWRPTRASWKYRLTQLRPSLTSKNKSTLFLSSPETRIVPGNKSTRRLCLATRPAH